MWQTIWYKRFINEDGNLEDRVDIVKTESNGKSLTTRRVILSTISILMVICISIGIAYLTLIGKE